MLLNIALDQGEQSPGNHRLQAHATVFEFGLLRQRIKAGRVRLFTPPLRKRSPQCMGKNA
jgi:hypothetical protein